MLLDTHALLWWLGGNTRLPVSSRAAIQTADAVFVSAVSAYEISQKVRLGKLEDAREAADAFTDLMLSQGFVELPVLWEHARRAGLMEGEHRDPFDRLLVAQALLNDLAIVSNDTVFDRFGVSRVW